MGRRLPWKREEVLADPPQEVKPPAPEREKVRERVAKTERLRSPSTSPPPEPPPERFMISGPLDDDRYRMVEDEFLSTAQLYTAHLHRAEYHRLKNQAKAHNAATIREIERPVVGSPTNTAKQRREASRRTAKQRDELGEDEHEKRLSRMSSGLQGLMESPRKETKFVRRFTQTTSSTRAAAGFRSRGSSPVAGSSRGVPSLESRHVSTMGDASDDNELNSGVILRESVSTGRSSRIIPTASSTKASASRSQLPTLPKPPPPKHVVSDDDNDDDDPFGIQKRRIRRGQSREQLRKTEKKHSSNTSPDVIPIFL